MIGELETRHRDQVIAGWLNADFEGVMDWYEALPRKEGKGSQKTYARAIGEGLASMDLEAAEEFARSWLDEDPFMPGRILEIVFKKRAVLMDFPELGQWADSVTNSGALDWQMLTATANRAVLNDPAMAIEWASTLLEKRDWVNNRIASRWKDINPQACSKWLLTRNPSEERDRSISSSFHRWAQVNRAECAEFLAGMEPSHDRDLVLHGMSWEMHVRDPIGAVDLAREISDPKQQQKQIFQLARYYWERLPEKAEVWFLESGLSEGEIDKIPSRKR